MGRRLLLAALVLVPRLSAAQDSDRQPVQELFLTETVYPQEKHEVQLTLGTLVDRSRPDVAALVPFSIEYGLTNRWQIQAGWDGYSQAPHDPLRHLRSARFSVGTKYSLMHIAHSHVHAAVGLDAEFPRPDAFPDGEGEGGTEIEPVVALAADLPAGIGVFGSFAASMELRALRNLAHGDRPDDPGTFSGGGLVAIKRATIAVEYTSRTDSLPWRLDGVALVTPSLFAHPGDHWELGVGLPIGLRDAFHHHPGLAMNATREF